MASNKYLNRYSDIIAEISKKFGVSEIDVENCIDHFFRFFKKCVTDSRMPKIQITNLGTFKPSIGKINFNIRSSIKKHKDGNLERDILVEKIKRVWPIRNRLINEKSGKITWNEWRKLENLTKNTNE